MVTTKCVLNLAPPSLLWFEEIVNKIKPKWQFFVKRGQESSWKTKTAYCWPDKVSNAQICHFLVSSMVGNTKLKFGFLKKKWGSRHFRSLIFTQIITNSVVPNSKQLFLSPYLGGEFFPCSLLRIIDLYIISIISSLVVPKSVVFLEWNKTTEVGCFLSFFFWWGVWLMVFAYEKNYENDYISSRYYCSSNNKVFQLLPSFSNKVCVCVRSKTLP